MSSLIQHPKVTFKQLIAVGLGGMIGATLRFTVSLLLTSDASAFPYNTITVNLLGSFVLAFIFSLSINKVKFNQTILIFLTTGILGSFTTFSTIMIDFIIVVNQSIVTVIIYLLVTFLGGITASILGIILGKRI